MPASCTSTRTTSASTRSDTRNAAAGWVMALVASSETTMRRSAAIERRSTAVAAWSTKARAAATAGSTGRNTGAHSGLSGGAVPPVVEAGHRDLVMRGAHVVDRAQRRCVEAAAAVATDETEAVLGREPVPQILERDGARDVALLPQQADHLAEGEQRAVGGSLPLDQGPDGLREEKAVRHSTVEQARQRRRRVE